MDLLRIDQPISGKRKPEEAKQTPLKLSKTEHYLSSGKRKANDENQAPNKRPNLNPFSPIVPPLFKTPSPQKTAPFVFDKPPSPVKTPPEAVFDKPPSPVKTPPEKLPLLIKSDPIAKLPLQQLAHTPAEKQLIHKFP